MAHRNYKQRSRVSGIAPFLQLAHTTHLGLAESPRLPVVSGRQCLIELDTPYDEYTL
jgi:hypothetical protein